MENERLPNNAPLKVKEEKSEKMFNKIEQVNNEQEFSLDDHSLKEWTFPDIKTMDDESISSIKLEEPTSLDQINLIKAGNIDGDEIDDALRGDSVHDDKNEEDHDDSEDDSERSDNEDEEMKDDSTEDGKFHWNGKAHVWLMQNAPPTIKDIFKFPQKEFPSRKMRDQLEAESLEMKYYLRKLNLARGAVKSLLEQLWSSQDEVQRLNRENQRLESELRRSNLELRRSNLELVRLRSRQSVHDKINDASVRSFQQMKDFNWFKGPSTTDVPVDKNTLIRIKPAANATKMIGSFNVAEADAEKGHKPRSLFARVNSALKHARTIVKQQQEAREKMAKSKSFEQQTSQFTENAPQLQVKKETNDEKMSEEDPRKNGEKSIPNSKDAQRSEGSIKVPSSTDANNRKRARNDDNKDKVCSLGFGGERKKMRLLGSTTATINKSNDFSHAFLRSSYY